jgi:hypothetical protein
LFSFKLCDFLYDQKITIPQRLKKITPKDINKNPMILDFFSEESLRSSIFPVSKSLVFAARTFDLETFISFGVGELTDLSWGYCIDGVGVLLGVGNGVGDKVGLAVGFEVGVDEGTGVGVKKLIVISIGF